MIKHLTRRHAIMAAAALGLSSCSTGLGRSAFWSTVSASIAGRAGESPVTQERIASIPYASIAAGFAGATPAMLILGEIEVDGSHVWYASRKQLIATWGPFVTRVIGIEIDLVGVEFGAGWTKDLRLMVGKRVQRTLTFGTDRRVTATETSRFSIGGVDDIEIYGRKLRLRKIVERVSAEGVHRFSNHYWIDDTGFCWKSQQTVIPTAGPFNIEVLRPSLATP